MLLTAEESRNGGKNRLSQVLTWPKQEETLLSLTTFHSMYYIDIFTQIMNDSVGILSVKF